MQNEVTLVFCNSAKLQILSVTERRAGLETCPCSPACPGQVEEIMLWMRLIDSLADCPSPELPSGCVSAGCNTLSGVCGTWWQRLVLVPKSSIGSSKCLALRYTQLLWKHDACCCSSALFWCLPSHPSTACSLQHHLSEFYSLGEERFWFAGKKKPLSCNLL